MTAAPTPAAGHDAPYHRLADLPRSLWLPALINSAGHSASRLADLPRWREALARGALPPADADFGDPAAVGPLRRACGELGLPALCEGAPAMAEQLLRTMLWQLDRLIDLQPRLSRPQAIAQVTPHFVGDVGRQLGPCVVHRQDDALDVELGVQVVADEVEPIELHDVAIPIYFPAPLHALILTWCGRAQIPHVRCWKQNASPGRE